MAPVPPPAPGSTGPAGVADGAEASAEATVATRRQVRELINAGLDYRAAARRLGIPAGLAYMIATGRPADGSDSPRPAGGEGSAGRPAGALASGGQPPPNPHQLGNRQDLSNPPVAKPAGGDTVETWIAARVAADEQMRAAGRGRAEAARG